eukprot:CAMPEP_0116036162 /NCGR_PEP_ID=MMETSP0321-20121206/20967_1 /TAXON_ID=163516 /ORGANISM="Leptocylindrus danicus var. danicus, Strain B650" /LENGTH=49 /DNA_ID=CAMNT_0003513469 /DNA_START=21 /DNA_END=170 /DNA_ORIENTATION=+
MTANARAAQAAAQAVAAAADRAVPLFPGQGFQLGKGPPAPPLPPPGPCI